MTGYRPENRNLFSDFYLESGAPVDFAELEAESRKAFDAISVLRLESKPERFTEGREQQLREEYLDKVLDILGWFRSGEGGIPGNGKPDYTLFVDAADKDAALSRLGSLEFFSDAVCLCEAKPWGVDLHRKTSEGRSPRGQIYGYLEDTHLPWGFASNGKTWLLVWREYSRAQQRDYAVDLDALLSLGHWTPAFNYFYAFFSRRGFSKNFPGQAVEKSRVSGEAVGRELTANVFEALLLLGRAIVAARRSDFSTREELAGLKADCLTFLYRLLFVNYAESRKLLPMKDSDIYRKSYSFLRVKEEVQRLAPGMQEVEYAGISTVGGDLLRKIRKLFRAIDQGDRLAQIPPYNGGLFRAEDHPLLESVEIGDQTIARIVDLLSRTREDPGRFVDYSYLGIRELGSIYEGLLEFGFSTRPGLRPGDGLGEVRPPGTRFVADRAADPAVGIRGPAVGVYLETATGERKTSGSFYTPDEVVRYIVQSCLGPIVDSRLANAGTVGQDPQQAILNIKVLDPAMGSGHFLVAATEYLAERLLALQEQGAEPTPEERSEVDELEAQAKRQVVSHCVYGVDLNPMAVELAKVSLWLATFSRGHPLTFLDHRLKCGNSLVGATLLDMAWLPKERPQSIEAPITQPQSLVREQLKVLGEIEAGLEDTVAQVKRKEEAYLKLQKSEDFQRFKTLANLHTGLYFSAADPAVIRKQYMEIANEVVYRDPEKWARKTKSSWVEEAIRGATDHHAFHWQLEFPDVLVNPARGPKGGFDAVVGNPPYVRAEVADKAERRYLMENPYFQRLVGRFDLSLPFLEQGLRLTRPAGRFGMIVSSPLLTTNYGERIRQWMLRELAVESVADFGSVEVFPGVGVRTCIIVIENSAPTSDHVVKVSAPASVELLGSGQRDLPQSVFESSEKSTIRVGLDETKLSIKDAIDSLSIPLGQLCYCITGVVAHDPKTHESKDRLISSTALNSNYKPYIEAKESGGRYAWIAPTRFIEYKPETPGHMHRPKFPELFSSNKLFIQGISGEHLIATLDSSGAIANHSMLCCVKAEDALRAAGRRNLSARELKALHPDPRYDLRYILGLLCSRLLGFYYTTFLSSGTGIAPDIVGLLPVKRVDFDLAAGADTASAVGRLEASEFDSAEFLKELDGLPGPSRGKVTHDYLSSAVTRIIENNRAIQTERQGFLSWLRNEIGTDPLALAGRSELRSYDSLDYGRLLSLLKKNRPALASDPFRRDFQDRLRDEFQASIGRIGPLKIANKLTEASIDAVVYRLYDLDSKTVEYVEANGPDAIRPQTRLPTPSQGFGTGS
jgi:type I restriction-modification system DNA methylase subunit